MSSNKRFPLETSDFQYRTSGVPIEILNHKKVLDVTQLKRGIMLTLEDGQTYLLYDRPDCCADKYLDTEEKIDEMKGATIWDIHGFDDRHPEEREYEMREKNFLHIITDRGIFSWTAYNEHNGYYGSIDLVVFLLTEAEVEDLKLDND